MYQFIAYLVHLITATNQHGVHSPFVYSYITKCLYAKTKFRGTKKEKVLLKSIAYFDVKKFSNATNDYQIENRVKKEFGLKPSNDGLFDLIYSDGLSEDLVTSQINFMGNNSFILVGNLHSTKESTRVWNELIQNKLITVSIDMFHCGALFIRKEQEKEHFKIRI